MISWAARVVGDDRIGPVDIVHQVPDDAVRVDRHFIRGKLGHPFLVPLLLDRLHLRRNVPIVTGANSIGKTFDLGDKPLQHQRGVVVALRARGKCRKFLDTCT